MNIHIRGDNVDITDSIIDLVDQKLAISLEKYLDSFNDDLKTATLKIRERSRWGYRVNFEMVLPGKEQIFAEAVDRELHTALLDMREKIIRQLKKYRHKISS